MTTSMLRSLLRTGLACALAAGAGCTVVGSMPRAPTEADFAVIQPGMSAQEVLARFGPPTWTFGVRQENLTIWNYRYNPFDCVIYQVSMRPDGTVRDAGTGYDPACDSGRGRFGR
jgi:hypothetical protein